MKKPNLLILAAACLTIICSSAVGASMAGTSQSSYISTEEAKDIALKHAGLTDAEAVWVTARLTRDDGRMIYDVEFWHDRQEYDYELDAYTGDILAYDFDMEGTAASGSENTGSDSNTGISADEAKAIALERAGLSEDQVNYIHIFYDYDDGMAVYQIDFIANNVEYEIEINADNGNILEYDTESLYSGRR